jgi:hypothetical protein
VTRRLEVLVEDRSPYKRCRRLAETRYNVDVGVEVYHELSKLGGGTIPTERGG